MPIREFKMEDATILDEYIKEEKNIELKNKLIIVQDKIKGVYIGSNKEEPKLNLKDEILKKYNLLARAIKEKRKVKITYDSYIKGPNERVIHPVELFIFRDIWYCAAFCEVRKDMSQFELNRILKYELLNEKYE